MDLLQLISHIDLRVYVFARERRAQAPAQVVAVRGTEVVRAKPRVVLARRRMAGRTGGGTRAIGRLIRTPSRRNGAALETASSWLPGVCERPDQGWQPCVKRRVRPAQPDSQCMRLNFSTFV